MIPYGKQTISEDDLAAVVETLKSDWLTQGPKVEEFEKRLAEYCGAKFAVVVSSGTAALHTAFFAIGLKEGDEFITTPLTFAATVNAGIWQGGRPVFVDVETATGNLDPHLIEKEITAKTKAIVPVDYTGRPANLEAMGAVAKKYGIPVIEDACQALGARYKDKQIGSISDLTVFSFHPVKTITTGEGGAILTNNEEYYQRMKKFVTHGITKKDLVQTTPGDWYYEMQELGLNYRLTDFQSALGISQLKKIDEFLVRRRQIADIYKEQLQNFQDIILPPFDDEEYQSSWHLFVIRLKGELENRRAEIFRQLREAGIGVQVHHIPVYLHPYYQKRGYQIGLCSAAEKFYQTTISLPIFPNLDEKKQDEVIKQITLLIK